MKFKELVLGLIITTFVGCNENVKHFYAKRGAEVITVITNKNIRYVINGECDKVPDTNYVKLDLSTIDREEGDEIVGCWEFQNRRWVIMENNVIIVQNRLDTSLYLFKNNLPLDSLGLPGLESLYKNPRYFDIVYEFYHLSSVSGDVRN